MQWSSTSLFWAVFWQSPQWLGSGTCSIWSSRYRGTDTAGAGSSRWPGLCPTGNIPSPEHPLPRRRRSVAQGHREGVVRPEGTRLSRTVERHRKREWDPKIPYKDDIGPETRKIQVLVPALLPTGCAVMAKSLSLSDPKWVSPF